MGRALQPGSTNPALQKQPKLKVQRGEFTYTVETKGGKSTYTVSNGAQSISLPIEWSFGAHAQTWVFERQGKFYESLVSYYPGMTGLDTTTGDESLAPHTLEEAFGRELTPGDIKACFGCHATNALQNGGLALEKLTAGVTCEHCHAGAIQHSLDAHLRHFKSHPPDLSSLSAEDISGFCGQCHRTWDSVVRNHWMGEINVRFQPYRLANSKCFDGADARISCLACHDPHQDLVRNDDAYDSKCLGCHTRSHANAAATSSPAKTCPVASAKCVSCHMPKVTLPGGHLTFTDHQIRVVRAGEPYPN